MAFNVNVTPRTVFALTWADLLYRPSFRTVRRQGRDLLGSERAGRNKGIVAHSPAIHAKMRPKRVVTVPIRLTGGMVRSLRPTGVYTVNVTKV